MDSLCCCQYRVSSYSTSSLYIGIKERLWRCFRHLKANPIYGHHVMVMLLVVHLIIGHRRSRDQLHRPEHVQALIEQVARGIESLGVGECAKLAKYLRNRAPGVALAQKSVLPRLEALAEPWSAQAVSLACICWYLVRALHKRPARARYRALSRHLLGACGALHDQLGATSASLLEAVEAVLHQRHRASSAIEGFNATLRPYLYVHKGATKRARAASGTQGFLALFRSAPGSICARGAGDGTRGPAPTSA